MGSSLLGMALERMTLQKRQYLSPKLDKSRSQNTGIEYCEELQLAVLMGLAVSHLGCEQQASQNSEVAGYGLQDPQSYNPSELSFVIGTNGRPAAPSLFPPFKDSDCVKLLLLSERIDTYCPS